MKNSYLTGIIQGKIIQLQYDTVITMLTVKKLEFEGLNFEVRYRPVKYSRIEFGSRMPVMVVPFGIDPLDILRKKRNIILRKHDKMLRQRNEARRLPLSTRSEREFKSTVDQYIDQFSKQLKVKYKLIKFRKMRRRWGSCRSDGFITLNRCLQFLPKRLLSYIVFHELAHLIIPGHNKRFKDIMFRQFPDFKVLESDLKLYGYRLLQ